MKRPHLAIVVVLLLAAAVVRAQDLKTDVIDGGSVVTDLGYGIQLNKGSTLKRSFVVINDPAAPAQLSNAGVNTRSGRDQYSFVPVGVLVPSEALAAVEVRFVLYDVFGNRIRTLSANHITDMSSGAPVTLVELGSWYASEHEASELLTVVAFVGNARTAAGKIWRANDKKLGEELAKLNIKVTAGALEPVKDEKRQ